MLPLTRGNYRSYKNDVEDMAKLGFDGVKFDAGGGNNDMNRCVCVCVCTCTRVVCRLSFVQ